MNIVYKIEWIIPATSPMAMISSHREIRDKVFSSKEKAEEFYKKMLEASQLIGVSLNLIMTEMEVE